MLNVLDFKTEYAVGKPPRDKVLVAPIGPASQSTRTWHYVHKIRPPDTDDEAVRDGLSYKDMAAKWEIIGPKYAAWKSGETLPESGTPLGAWAGVTAEQAKVLRSLHITTVEAVRDMGESTIEKLQWPNIRKLPVMAKEYLEGAADTDKDAKMAEMQEQMDAMMALLEERTAADEKPKRGRPAKKATDEAEDETA